MICFVTALDAEAKPLIKRFSLKRVMSDHGFPTYRNDDLFLIVSGMGKSNAAAATAHLHGIAGFPENAIWINVGIAGHADLAIGEARLIHKITDQATGRNWYPPIVVPTPWKTAALRTVDLPDGTYSHDDLIDMEASGFIETATRFSTAELIHCIKIVSDNRESPVKIPKPAQVSGWIAPQHESLELFLAALNKAAQPLFPHPDLTPIFEQITARWHFTTSQKNQLHKYLQRWLALNPDDSPIDAELTALSDAGKILQHLQQQLEAQKLVLS